MIIQPSEARELCWIGYAPAAGKTGHVRKAGEELCICAQLSSSLTRTLRIERESEAALASRSSKRNEAQIMRSKRFLIMGAAVIAALTCSAAVSSIAARTSPAKQSDEAA